MSTSARCMPIVCELVLKARAAETGLAENMLAARGWPNKAEPQLARNGAKSQQADGKGARGVHGSRVDEKARIVLGERRMLLRRLGAP
eukprot:2927854-Pleurochrysis_carterae.AAC.1